jgi:hypothetical protein
MSDRMDDGVEITRDAVDLETLIRDQPEDPNVLDTALILTNQTAQPARARCVAYNHLGEAEVFYCILKKFNRTKMQIEKILN